MTKPLLEYLNIRQLKIWKQQAFEIYNKCRDIFEEQRLGEGLRDFLNNLNNLLNILLVKLPCQLKIARVREFMEELEDSRYVGRLAEQIYRDIKEVINEVFNVPEAV